MDNPSLLARVAELNAEVHFLRSVIITMQDVINKLQNQPIYINKGE